MAKWKAAGKMKWRETIADGIDKAPEAFIGLFKGENFGKMLVRVGPDQGGLAFSNLPLVGRSKFLKRSEKNFGWGAALRNERSIPRSCRCASRLPDLPTSGR